MIITRILANKVIPLLVRVEGPDGASRGFQTSFRPPEVYFGSAKASVILAEYVDDPVLSPAGSNSALIQSKGMETLEFLENLTLW